MRIFFGQEELDAQFAQALQESQGGGEGDDLDPHLLSREQNTQIIESVFGPSKKGRRRFRGAGVWTGEDTTPSFEPTMPSPPYAAAIGSLSRRTRSFNIYLFIFGEQS